MIPSLSSRSENSVSKQTKTTNRESFPLWPRSLAGQLMVALLLALLVAQAISIVLFARERSNIAVTTTRGQVLDRTASVVRVLNETDDTLHHRVIRAAEGPSLLYRIQDRTTPVAAKTGLTRSRPHQQAGTPSRACVQQRAYRET